MDSPARLMATKLPSKLKMIECKVLLGCREDEWTEIGSALLEITKEYELCSLSWSSPRYEDATNAAMERIPILTTLLSRIKKDDKYRHEIVKRMITVKAKKQTELEMRRRNRSGGTTTPNGHVKKSSAQLSNISVDSRTPSPEAGAPVSSQASPIPYPRERETEQIIPKPFQHTRPILTPSDRSPRNVLSPAGQSSSGEISDIFLAQTQQYVLAFRNLQEALRRRDADVYALQSRVIELESQLEVYRRVEGRDGSEVRGQQYRR